MRPPLILTRPGWPCPGSLHIFCIFYPRHLAWHGHGTAQPSTGVSEELIINIKYIKHRTRSRHQAARARPIRYHIVLISCRFYLWTAIRCQRSIRQHRSIAGICSRSPVRWTSSCCQCQCLDARCSSILWVTLRGLHSWHTLIITVFIQRMSLLTLFPCCMRQLSHWKLGCMSTKFSLMGGLVSNDPKSWHFLG